MFKIEEVKMCINFEINDFLNVEEHEKFLKALRIEIPEEKIERLYVEYMRDNPSSNAEEEKVRIRKVEIEKLVELNLRKVALAAGKEFIEIILGKQVNSKADDFIKRKIYQLIKCFYISRMPTESEIVSVFQVTETMAKRLIRDLRATNRNDLEEEINQSVKGVLTNPIEKSGNNLIFLIRSENILEEIKQTVSIEAAELDQVQKQKNSACSYLIPIDTYKRLCHAYSLDYEALTREL